MANRWLASNLARSLKLRGLLPTSGKTFSIDDFYFLLDEAIRLHVVTLVLEVNDSDYLTQHTDIAVVSGTARYAISDRAASEQLELIQFGSTAAGWAAVDDISRRDNTGIGGAGLAFQLDDDALILVPTPTTTGTLRVHYRARPGRLVDAAACGEVTAINTGTKTVTVVIPTTVTGSGTTPSSTAFTTSLTYDFVAGRPGFRTVGLDYVANVVGGGLMTFTTTLPTSLRVGDYVAIAGESPIAQLPEGVHPLVSAWGALICERALGDPLRIASAKDEVDKAEASAKSLLSKQKGATSSPVINPYARGNGRSTSIGRWFR